MRIDPISPRTLLVLGFTLFCLCPRSWAAEDAGSGPVIEFEETTFDFGLVRPDRATVFTHDFVFKNTGRETLKILSVGSACLTLVLSYRSEIPPGESSYIRVTTTLGENRTMSERDFQRSIDIECNDPANPKIQLKMEAKFAYTLEWEQSLNLDVGQVVGGGTREWSISIESATDAHFQITKIAYDAALFDLKDATAPWTSRPAEKGDGKKPAYPKLVFNFGISEDAPSGPFFKTFELTTDREDIPVISIPVSGEVLADWSVDSEEIFLGIITSETPITKKIQVSSANSGFTVKQATSDVPGLTATIEKHEEAFCILVEYDPVLPESDLIDGELAILTNSSSTPEIKIPIRALNRLPRKEAPPTPTSTPVPTATPKPSFWSRVKGAFDGD